MNAEELHHYKTRLENELKEFEQAHDAHKQSLLQAQDRTAIESGDWPQEIKNVEVDSNILLNEDSYLKKMNHALERISLGTYGICEACDEAIPKERLDAKPSVSLCIACQEEKENS